MSFANQYIQKYGDRAIEAYKRSLRHADPPLPDSPRLHPTTRPPSCNRHPSRSKSSKSFKPLSKKHPPSKSLIEPAKPKIHSQPFNSVHLNVQGKKRLVIEAPTPKGQTPSKHIGRTPLRNSTNVNVYVQAIHKSKSRSKQTTPSRDILIKNSRESSPKRLGEAELLKFTLQLLQEERNKRDSRGLRLVRDKLTELQGIVAHKSKRMGKLQAKFDKLRTVMKKEWEVDSDDRGDRGMRERVKELEGQVEKYKEKEQALLKIVESLSGRHSRQWKGSQEGDNSQSEDEL